tara:strand:+ start:1153 stop:1452 length:300 start_codon:yes stop_codon:yes gene_type:complete
MRFRVQAQLDKLIKIPRIGGAATFELDDMKYDEWFSYSDFRYLADRLCDDMFISVHVAELPSRDDGTVELLDWKINVSAPLAPHLSTPVLHALSPLPLY